MPSGGGGAPAPAPGGPPGGQAPRPAGQHIFHPGDARRMPMGGMTRKSLGAGSDSEGKGLRHGRIAPVKRVDAKSGTPTGATKTQQRGSKKSPMEQALDAIQDAKELGANPSGDKKKKGGLPR